jgi:hypothetical protein
MSTSAHRILSRLPLILATGLFAAACLLLWLVRSEPRSLPLFILLDAPGVYLALIAALGCSLSLLAIPEAGGHGRAWRQLAALVCIAGAAICAVPLVAAALLLIAGLLRARLDLRRPSSLATLVGGGAALVAAAALLLRGVRRYDDPAAGAAIDSWVFLLTLLAACAPIAPLDRRAVDREEGWREAQVIWLLPLLRLYPLGPWNDGWSLAATLLGGALALWAALGALTRATPADRGSASGRMIPALALASAGLASSAGVAACCYAMLAHMIISVAPSGAARPRWAHWSVAGVIPLSAVFIAAWMAIGAAAAAGSTALAGALWLACLIRGIALLTEGDVGETRGALIAGVAALALGVLAPAVSALLIQPVVDQLQGGLTAYGNLSVAPWVGITLLDSGSRVIATAPTMLVAGLMVVLLALCVLLARLWPPHSPTPSPNMGEGELYSGEENGWRAALLREVPWLGRGRDDDPA